MRRRVAATSDLGQTAIVAVVAISISLGLGAALLVNTVSQTYPLAQAKSVQIYANRALQAGENAYLTAINANPSLAQCNTNTNGSGICSGINYGEWNYVQNSTNSGADAEYYAFGNPQPTFSSTDALTNLAVQIVGAAKDPTATNGYLIDEETINLNPENGFLKNVWWSNYESYSSTGSYSTCNYNWNLPTSPTNYSYNILNDPNVDCSPVYFGPGDYLYGPVYTNDSVFVSGDGTANNSPSFGTSTSPSAVSTADPKCLFVDSTHGMNGSSSNCSTAKSDVAVYDTVNSSDNNTVEQPPTTDSSLGTIASENGCLYSGPTQITLSTNATTGVGEMTVVSPDTSESTVISNGTSYTWDNDNISTNLNDCPNNGTATLPPNGVVYVENATTAQTQAWANPFDDPIYNTVTNLTSNPAYPLTAKKSQSVTLTATVTSDSNQADTGATVAFSQSTTNGYQTSTSVISSCSSVALSTPTAVTPATNPPTYQATATCSTTESSNSTGAFSAAYSGGTYTASSSANLGQTNTLTSSESYGPYSQVTAGGCNSCYYGETGTPDAEGDAFVNGSLSGQLTIGTANNVIIDGNITYADCDWGPGPSGSTTYASEGNCPYNSSGTNDALGLIADNYVEINRPVVTGTSTIAPACASTVAATCDQTTGSGLTIDAAILALTQSFVVNNYADGGSEGQLIVYGSIQQYARGPVGTFNNGSPPTVASGYVKHYTWDPLLDFVSPPSYLVPSVAPWSLTSVITNAGVGSSDTCPPLDGPYPGTDGTLTYVTGYCSATTGGLPGFPSITVPSPPYNVTATANADGSATVTWTDPITSNGSTITGYTVAPTPNCSACSGTSVSGATATTTTITGLTPGSTYTFAVSAASSAGSSTASTASNSIVIPTVPSSPTNVVASANNDGSLTVTWTDPSNGGSPITGYTVTPSPACSGCSYTSLSGASVTSAVVTGATPGASYTFTVSATNGIGTGNSSTASNSVTAPNVPGAPTIGSVTASAGAASVSWTAPSSNGGATITGYMVTPYIAGVAQTPQTFTSTATTQTVSGLTNGTAYTFTVAAINGVGTGAQSAQSSSVTPITVPGAPTIGTATSGNASATVTWTAPSSNGGSAITGYTVIPFIGTNAQTAQTFSSTATTETVTGLTNGTAYTFEVEAKNAAGTGVPSAASNSVTPATVPGAPTIGSATASNASATVTWTAPASNGGSVITGYVVTPYIAGVAQTAQTFSTAATTESVTGLTNGTAYTFTVAAINSVGTGAQSGASNSVTPITVPGAPTIGTATAGNASATVTWTAPSSNGGSAITGYVVTPYIGTLAQTSQTFSSTGTTETVTGLTNGTTYTFQVAAINAAGTGAQSGASNAVTPATVPGAPTGVSATASNASANVSWTAPSSNGGSAITGYVVTPYIGATAQTAQTFSSTATTETVTGLTNGTAYTFKVAAINGIGTGALSSASNSVTPITVPGAPTIGTATGGNAQATVTWTAPSSNGGSAITGYVVTPYIGTLAQTATTFSSTATSQTVTGLTNGTTYTFQVAAINAAGTGPQSAGSNAVTPITVATAPTIGTVTSGNTQVTVNWTAPSSNGGAAITGYTVTPYIGSTAQTAQTFSSTATTEIVTGLTNGTAYTFKVAAINAAGTGPQSAASSSVTPATVPGAPTIGTATAGGSSASVSWTAPSSNGGATITGYTVTPYIGSTAQTAQTFGTATTETVTGLTAGTAYTFKVAAINSAGTGAQSAASNSVTPFTVPGAPTIGTASKFSNGQATVTWTAPSSNGGSAITGYVVTPYLNGTTAQTATTFSSTATSETVTGLTHNSSYTFKVAAINAAGTGSQSGASNSVTV